MSRNDEFWIDRLVAGSLPPSRKTMLFAVAPVWGCRMARALASLRMSVPWVPLTARAQIPLVGGQLCAARRGAEARARNGRRNERPPRVRRIERACDIFFTVKSPCSCQGENPPRSCYASPLDKVGQWGSSGDIRPRHEPDAHPAPRSLERGRPGGRRGRPAAGL